MKTLLAAFLVMILASASVHAAETTEMTEPPLQSKREGPSTPVPAAAAGEAAAIERAVKSQTEKPVAATKVAMQGAPVSPRARGVNYIGQIETYKARDDDTLLTIGEREDLGYVELRSANPAMDPWRPGGGAFVILPKMHLLPDAPRNGIVVNLSEMRMYFFAKDGNIQSHPIGVGREGFSTPMGTTTVVRKVVGPTWRPTDRMRREDPSLPAVVGPGEENPLGTHALYLGWPQYMLHGSNKPWGIGRRVSSGCVRMYNNDAEQLFKTVPVGTPVMVVRQPIKFGWINDMLYIEAHPDGALADQVERMGGNMDYKVPDDIFQNISKAAGADRDHLDWMAIRVALKERRGYPVPILNNTQEAHYFVTPAMADRAGTSRFGPRLTQAPLQKLVPSQERHLPEDQDATPQQAETAPARPRRSGSGFNG